MLVPQTRSFELILPLERLQLRTCVFSSTLSCEMNRFQLDHSPLIFEYPKSSTFRQYKKFCTKTIAQSAFALFGVPCTKNLLPQPCFQEVDPKGYSKRLSGASSTTLPTNKTQLRTLEFFLCKTFYIAEKLSSRGTQKLVENGPIQISCFSQRELKEE